MKENIAPTEAAQSSSSRVERSHAYPAFTLDESFEFVKKIYQALGTNSYNTRESIASAIGLSHNTVPIPISTANQYGLLEMKVKSGYKPTELFLKIHKPLNESEGIEARLTCLRHPKLYAALFEEFKNSPVSQKGLSTVLFRKHNISDKACAKAAETFIANVSNIGLLDTDGILRESHGDAKAEPYVEDYIEAESEEVKGPTALYLPPSPDKPRDAKPSVTYVNDDKLLVIEFDLKSGKVARFEYAKDLADSDWNKIIKILEAMRE